MEPVSLVLAALTAGAAAAGAGASDGLTTVAKDAVGGLYARLKAAIVGKAGAEEPGAAKALDRHAGDPRGYEAPVRDLVVEAGADRDDAILELARELLRHAEPEKFADGVYTVTQSANAEGQARVYQAGRDLNVNES
jgi:hypothetical protein